MATISQLTPSADKGDSNSKGQVGEGLSEGALDAGSSAKGVGEGQDVQLNIWDKIDRELGKVTDFEISQKEKWNEINYKSNGISHRILLTDKSNKIIVQSLLYILMDFKST